jgi:hypothetical protein
VAIATAGGLAITAAPALAQSSLSEPPRPDPDGAYGEDLQPFKAEGPLTAIISLGSQKIQVFDRNGMVAASKVSTGRKGYDTPEGIFSIIERKVEHNSNLYDDAEMPFMQRLTWSGVALHQGVVPGYRASHGCIRLPRGFAERLFRTTRLGTRVIVTSRDATPIPLTHATLPQPGDPPPAVPSVEAAPAEPEAVAIATAAEDASSPLQPAVAIGNESAQPVKPSPGLAELRARRITLERELAEATRILDEAKVGVRPRLIEQGKAEKAVRQATALANRAERRAGLMADAVDAAESEAERQEAVVTHLEALVELTETRSRETAAREVAAQAAAAAKSVQNHVRKLADARQQVFNRYRIVARRLSPVTIFVSREAGRVYVHQATHPVMELPIAIRDADRPIGTHVFTAWQIDDQPDVVRWTGVTLVAPGGNAASLASARSALDRFELPQPVLARIMPALQPGSTVIVSDLGKSIENGPGTDIIVQTRGEAEAARSIARFQSRQRGERWSGGSWPERPRRRVGSTSEWYRW